MKKSLTVFLLALLIALSAVPYFYADNALAEQGSCASLFDLDDGVTASANVGAPNWTAATSGLNGVMLSANQNGLSAAFKNHIDLSRASKSVPLIEFLIIPTNVGEKDFGQLIIRLEDASDSGNFLELSTCENVWDPNVESARGSSRLSAKNDKSKYFISQETATIFPYPGSTGADVEHGLSVLNGFQGPASGQPTVEPIRWYYDAAEVAAYAYRATARHTNGVASVAFFKDENFLNGTANAAQSTGPANLGAQTWQGFKTGRVKMTLTFNRVVKTAKILVTKINGVSLSGDGLPANTGASTVVVDTLGYPENALPVAEAGVPYRIFPAHGVNIINGTLPVDIKAYAEGASGSPFAITNGAFTPPLPGNYILEYNLAAGLALPSAVRTLTVTAVASVPQATLSLSSPAPSTAFVGQTVYIPNDFTLDGGSGRLNVKTYFREGGNPRRPIGYSFEPQQDGSSTVIYAVEDYIKEYTFEFPITVSYASVPFVSEPNVPRAVAVKNAFTAVDFDARYFTPAGQAALNKYVNITKGGETRRLNIGEKYPVGNDAGEMTAEYVAEVAGNAALYWKKTYTVSIVKPAYVHDYFISENAGYTRSTTYTVAAPVQPSAPAVMSFINALSANLSFQFNAETGGTYDCFNVRVTDFADSRIALDFTFAIESGNVAMYLNGEKQTSQFKLNANSTAATTFLRIDNAAKKVYSNNEFICGIEKTAFGQNFDGFRSGMVYLELTLNGGAVRLNNLNGQTFYNSNGDFINPYVEIDGEIPFSAEHGATLTVPAAKAFDVLSPETSITVTVAHNGGTVLFDKVATSAPFTFTAGSFGEYKITYSARDGSGNSYSKEFTVFVVDKTPPVLSINGDVRTYGFTGREIKLPEASLTDNNSKDMRLYIFVITPNDGFFTVQDNKFTPSEVGLYIVRYYAYDDNFNTVLLDFQIKVYDGGSGN